MLTVALRLSGGISVMGRTLPGIRTLTTNEKDGVSREILGLMLAICIKTLHPDLTLEHNMY